MAAPSGTVWGSVVGSYGKLGLYVSKSSTNTETTVTVEIWFASKYSVSDSANTLYYDIGYAKDGGATTSKGSVSVSTSVASGSGWSTSNQIKIKTYTATYTRANSTATKYIYAKLADVDRVGGTMAVSTTVQIPGLTSYAIKYNANGGSGAPSAQTKYYGKNIALSSSKPTRTGYSFQKWNTKSDGSGTSYNPGVVYSGNEALTLYAIWKANTYTITFNANGGSLGSVSSTKTKTYGVTMTLPTAKPTRTNYTFLGWSTSKTATSATYAAGGSFTTNANTTLYAVWSLAYKKPRVKITSISRVSIDANNNTVEDENGTGCRFTVDVITDKPIVSQTGNVYDSSGKCITTDGLSWSGPTTSAKLIGTYYELDPEKSYKIEYTVTDEGGSGTAVAYLPSTKYIIDIRKGGTGIAFGKTAEKDDVFDVNHVGHFSKEVYHDSSIYVGSKTNWNDANTGWYIGSDGTAHVTVKSGGGGIYFHYAGNSANTASIRESSTGVFAIAGAVNATGNITSDGNMRIGDGDSSTRVARAINTYWADNAIHNLVERYADGLTSAYGWAGSSDYASVTRIRGRTCQYQNSSGTTALSDERLKKDFCSLSKWDLFYKGLEPCAFRMKNGSSGRFHIGFKAQQVEQALIDSGLTSQDFAGFVKMKYTPDSDDPENTAAYSEAGINPGDDECGLIYTEFVALNTYMIQKLQTENSELKDRVSSLEARLAAIETLIGEK